MVCRLHITPTKTSFRRCLWNQIRKNRLRFFQHCPGKINLAKTNRETLFNHFMLMQNMILRSPLGTRGKYNFGKLGQTMIKTIIFTAEFQKYQNHNGKELLMMRLSLRPSLKLSTAFVIEFIGTRESEFHDSFKFN